MTYRVLAYLIVVMSSLGGALSTWAHPHVWIESVVSFELSNDGLDGLLVSWYFDEWNSADMRVRFDRNLDGRIDEAEQFTVYNEAFIRLRDIDYFLRAETNDRNHELPEATEFRAFIDDERFVYQFRMPLRLSWAQIEGLVVGIFDDSYYVSFFSSSERDVYTVGSRSASVSQVPQQFDTDGWGWVNAPALEVTVE